MKKKFLFSMVLVLSTLTFFSCSKEDAVDEPSGGKEVTETYAAVSISFPQTMQLRSADPLAANTLESTVTTIGVYVVDDLSGFMHKGHFSSSQFTKDPLDEKYRLTAAVKTTTGAKTIYVVLNPATTLHNSINAGLLGDSPINGTAEPDFVSASDLIMSSVAGVSATLTVQTETAALGTPLGITVQRNTAKVAVKKKNAVIDVVGGSVNDLKFALLVEAKKSYLIQQGGNLYTSVQTPGQNISPITTINDYFTKVATPTNWKNINENAIANNSLTGFYTLENVNTTKVVGNTTAAIIKAQFTPTSNTVVVGYAADQTRTLGSITPGQSFYVKKSDYTFWSEQGYADALANGFTAAHFSKKYDNGTSYYRIWVQDGNNNIGVLRNNYYVLNVNKITGPGLPYVPGVDPDDPSNPEDPDKPIDEDTYISVEVTVLPWDVQTTDHDL